MAAPNTVKEASVRKAVQEEKKRAKKPVVVAEAKTQDECCEPGCGPGTCNS